MSYDIFISYTHRNKVDVEFAETLESKLTQEGLEVFRDVTRIPNGAPWRSEIDAALEAASLLVLIISPDSMKAEYVTYEWCYGILALNKPRHLVHLRQCESDDGMFESLRCKFQMPKSLNGRPTQKDWDTILTEIKDKLGIPRAIKDAGYQLIKSNQAWLEEDGLKDVDKEMRRVQAAEQLGQYAEEPYKWESCYHLLKGIEHEISTGGYGPVEIAIASALCKVGDLRAIPALIKLREHEEKKIGTKDYYEDTIPALEKAIQKLVNLYSKPRGRQKYNV